MQCTQVLMLITDSFTLVEARHIHLIELQTGIQIRQQPKTKHLVLGSSRPFHEATGSMTEISPNSQYYYRFVITKLEEDQLSHPGNCDLTDAMGRTILSWAAAGVFIRPLVHP